MPESERQILMFNATQRFVHWLHTAAFAILMVTGVILYAPWLSTSLATGEGGCVIRLVHRIGAVAFMLVPVAYVVFSPREFITAMKRVFTWGREDLGWLQAAPVYYFLGDEEAMPPQDKYNTGQKLFYVVVVVCMVGFIATGLLMWFGKGVIPVWMFQWSVFVHDVCTVAYGAFFLVHFVLSVMHPLMKGALDGMLFGWMPEDYVKHHHAKFYEELQSRGE